MRGWRVRYRGVGDGGEEEEGGEEMRVADSAGERRGGTVGADGEHISQQPSFTYDDRSQRLPACHKDRLAYQKNTVIFPAYCVRIL